MLIVLEGCDGAGKTTFAQRLAFALPSAIILHRGVPQRHPLVEYEQDIDWYIPGVRTNLICDRWHWGEPIYGELYRGESMLGQPGLDHVSMFMASRGAVTVFLDPSRKLIKERLEQRGEDYLQAHDVDTVITNYRILAHDRRRFEAVLRNPTLEMVLQYARAHERAAVRITPLRTYVGSLRPEILLVGDQIGPGNVNHHAAAFVPYPPTSGWYLLDAIADMLPRCGLLNSWPHPVQPMWERLGKPRLVALGKAADNRLALERLPHGAVPHPQYWRRFHYHEPACYAKMIDEAMEVK